MLLQNIFLVILGLLGLFFGGSWLVKGAARLALSLGVSTLVVGLTIVAFGTSLPELFVSLDAAAQGASDISVGNVVGSNIANIGLILGLTALIFPVPVKKQVVRRELPVMLAISVLIVMLIQDNEISRLEGALLFGGVVAYTLIAYFLAAREKEPPEEVMELLEEAELGSDAGRANRLFELGRLTVGLVVVVLGANLLVDGAVNIAVALGVPKLIIGLTLVAVGTSLPELATSLIASLRKENDIAVGNIVGSNIFNILAILGITAMVQPIGVNQRVLDADILVMLAFSLGLLLAVQGGKVTRWQGGLFLLAYFIFTTWAFMARGSA